MDLYGLDANRCRFVEGITAEKQSQYQHDSSTGCAIEGGQGREDPVKDGVDQGHEPAQSKERTSNKEKTEPEIANPGSDPRRKIGFALFEQATEERRGNHQQSPTKGERDNEGMTRQERAHSAPEGIVHRRINTDEGKKEEAHRLRKKPPEKDSGGRGRCESVTIQL